jgi:hypothetical protein
MWTEAIGPTPSAQKAASGQFVRRLSAERQTAAHALLPAGPFLHRPLRDWERWGMTEPGLLPCSLEDTGGGLDGPLHTVGNRGVFQFPRAEGKRIAERASWGGFLVLFYFLTFTPKEIDSSSLSVSTWSPLEEMQAEAVIPGFFLLSFPPHVIMLHFNPLKKLVKYFHLRHILKRAIKSLISPITNAYFDRGFLQSFLFS